MRKLTAHGGDGLMYMADGGRLTDAEAKGAFEIVGDDRLRCSLVRSCVSGRDGAIAHGLLRVAQAHERPRRR